MEEKEIRKDYERLVSGLREKEPRLSDPEGLTDHIMQAIQQKAGGTGHDRHPEKKSPRALTVAIRILAAASVCLFLTLGYEQYIVVAKIGQLERQNATISQNSRYRTAVSLNHLVAIIKSNPEFLNQYNKIRKDEGVKLSLIKAAFILDIVMIAGNDSIFQNQSK